MVVPWWWQPSFKNKRPNGLTKILARIKNKRPNSDLLMLTIAGANGIKNKRPYCHHTPQKLKKKYYGDFFVGLFPYLVFCVRGIISISICFYKAFFG